VRFPSTDSLQTSIRIEAHQEFFPGVIYDKIHMFVEEFLNRFIRTVAERKQGRMAVYP